MINYKSHLAELNLPLHRSFVAPVLCKDLLNMGLHPALRFVWKIFNGSAFIWSNDFDPDNYYTNSEKIIDSFTSVLIIPAFQAADLEIILPPFIHTSNTTTHEIYIKDYEINISAIRYPDALAQITLELMKLKILNPSSANRILAKN